MGNLVTANDYRTIDLGEGESAVLRTKLSYEDLEACNAHFAAGQMLLGALVALKSWDVKSGDGETVLELNEANLKRIDHKAINRIVEACNDLFTVPKASAAASETQ